MPRFNERGLQWTDIIGRFEARSYSEHLRHALSFVVRLRDEGNKIWDNDTRQLHRWHQCCNDLWTFLNNLSQRRDLEKQGLETAMRDFIGEFEHSTGRMEQMMYGAFADSGCEPRVKEIRVWFDLAFRSSIYALVAGWNDDKRENGSLRITVNFRTGEERTEGTLTEMKVPKKYRRATKRL